MAFLHEDFLDKKKKKRKIWGKMGGWVKGCLEIRK